MFSPRFHLSNVRCYILLANIIKTQYFLTCPLKKDRELYSLSEIWPCMKFLIFCFFSTDAKKLAVKKWVTVLKPILVDMKYSLKVWLFVKTNDNFKELGSYLMIIIIFKWRQVIHVEPFPTYWPLYRLTSTGCLESDSSWSQSWNSS